MDKRINESPAIPNIKRREDGTYYCHLGYVNEPNRTGVIYSERAVIAAIERQKRRDGFYHIEYGMRDRPIAARIDRVCGEIIELGLESEGERKRLYAIVKPTGPLAQGFIEAAGDETITQSNQGETFKHYLGVVAWTDYGMDEPGGRRGRIRTIVGWDLVLNW